MVKGRRKKRSGNKHPAPQTREAARLASVGNKFWQLRSKHGRDKLFATPQLMWEAACEYFQWCDDNPFYRAENKVVSNGGNAGSSVELYEEPVKRVYTLEGLCLYIGCSTSYFREFKRISSDKDFLSVIDAIQQTVYEQQFNGASTGFFNANIISRALGLVEKTDHTTAGEKIEAPQFNIYNNAPPLADEEQKVQGKTKK